MMPKISNYAYGHGMEKLARFWLLLKGYRLLAYNYQVGRTPQAGEIDLIVKKKNTIVFVEVKKRTSLSLAAYAVVPKQRERIRTSASIFLAKNKKYIECDVRFDVFLFSSPWNFQHLKNVF